jgi:hypothetical protein
VLNIVTYLWGDKYSPDDVRLLKRMVDRHLAMPHGFVCVTDNPDGFAESEGVATVEMLRDGAGRMFCAEKLFSFHPEAGKLLGDRFAVMDLDCAVTGPLDALFDRPEPLVLWRNPSRRPWGNPRVPSRALYNGSLLLMTAGARADVWTRYVAGEAWDYHGDQDWISAVVGPNCPYWDDADGVYRLAREDTPGSGVTGDLPGNARLVFFVGSEHKPDLPHVRAQHPWIAEHRV